MKLIGERLPMKAKVGYAFGGGAGTVIYTLNYVALTYFYTNIMGMSIAAISIVMLISRCMDGVSDFFAGVLIERTKSKYGKARPWLLRMAIPHFIAIVAMFTVPHTSEALQLVYVFIAYNVANTIVNTIIGLALTALNSLMTRVAKERSALSTFRQIGAFLVELMMTGTIIPIANLLGGGQTAWIIVIAAISFLSAICYLICFFFAKETSYEERGVSEGDKVPVGKGILSVLKNKYWWMSLCTWGLITTYLASHATDVTYYAQYLMGNVNYSSMILTTEKALAFIFALLVVPFAIKKFSNRQCMIIGACSGAFGHLVVLIAPLNLPLAMVAAGFRGVCSAFCFCVIFAMVADCVEYGHWRFNLRAEGFVTSAATLGQKFAQGIATAILGALLASVGYDGTLAMQAEVTNDMISYIYFFAPTVCFGLILVIMKFYKLDEEMPEITKEIKERAE